MGRDSSGSKIFAHKFKVREYVRMSENEYGASLSIGKKHEQS